MIRAAPGFMGPACTCDRVINSKYHTILTPAVGTLWTPGSGGKNQLGYRTYPSLGPKYSVWRVAAIGQKLLHHSVLYGTMAAPS